MTEKSSFCATRQSLALELERIVNDTLEAAKMTEDCGPINRAQDCLRAVLAELRTKCSHPHVDFGRCTYCDAEIVPSAEKQSEVDRDAAALAEEPSLGTLAYVPSTVECTSGERRIYDALMELVECKDLRDSFDTQDFRDNLTEEQQAEQRLEYERRKHLAWDEARRVLRTCVPSSTKCTPTELSYDQREEIISRLQHVRITDWMPDGDCPGHIREVTAADMLDCVLESLREFLVVPSATEGSEAVPVKDIERQIDDIERNGISLAKYGGQNADEGRCRELCAMYLREFIVAWRMKQKLASLRSSSTETTNK